MAEPLRPRAGRGPAGGRTPREAQAGTVTEQIYRKQIRPVIDDGATAMNRLFSDEAG